MTFLFVSKISTLVVVLIIAKQAQEMVMIKPDNMIQDSRLRNLTKTPSGVNLKRSPPARHIIVTTLETAPFMMKRQISNGNGSSVEWHGYCMDLFNELIKHLPYEVTFEIYQVADNKYGTKSKQTVLETNKTSNQQTYKKLERWNGLIGDLQQDKAHLALAPLAVMAERELAVDFTVPFYDLVGIQILLKKPEVPQDLFKFLTVLDGEVWFSIMIAYFVTSFVIFLFDRLSPYSHKNLSRIKKLKERQKLDTTEPTDSWIKSQNNHTMDSFNRDFECHDYSSNFNNEFNQGERMILPSDHLAKSHQLFVGSLSNSNLKVPRQSALSFPNFDSILDRRRGSVHPIDNKGFKSGRWQHNRKGSKTMSEYFQSINFRKGVATWDLDEADSEELDGGKPDFGLRDSLWFCITSLTPQGGGEAPQNLSGRVVAGAWWLFCFIIIASYTANLAAFLTVSRLDIPIENLDDLVKQYRIKYAPVDGTAEQAYFERMAYIEEIFYNIWKEMSLNNSLSEEERSKFAVWDYPISDKYTKIWAQIQQVGMPADIDSGIKRVKNSNIDDGFALLADANLVKHAVMTDCSFKSVGDEFSRKPIALGVRKGDEQFKDDLSYAILQLINQRFMEILREKWWTNNPNRLACDNNDESEGISIENIGGVFIIIFAGVALSFLVWAIERFVYKTKIGVSQELIQKL